MEVITYPCTNRSWTMLAKWVLAFQATQWWISSVYQHRYVADISIDHVAC